VRRIALAAAVLLVLVAGEARAEDDDDADDTARARAELRAGVALYEQTPPDYAGALQRFRVAYAARPSPAIKRNVALCLRALGRNAEAMDALDEMLVEGGAALEPRAREAAQRALEELAPKVARVRIDVGFALPAPDPRPPVEVRLDGAPVPPSRVGRAVRVDPGTHAVLARAPGFADAEVRVSVAAGQPEATVSLELARLRPLSARLRLVANYPDAEIAVDGVTLGRGEWSGALSAGRHAVDVSSPVGRYAAQLVVEPGESRHLQVVLTRSGAWAYPVGRDGAPPAPASAAPPGAPPSAASPVGLPPPYEDADRPPAGTRALRAYLPSHLYVAAGGSVHGMNAMLSPRLDDASGASRQFFGGSLVLRAGATLAPWLQLGALGEVGGTSSDTFMAASRAGETRATAMVWSLAPELRVRTTRNVRLFAGVAVGVQGLHFVDPGEARPVSRGGIGLFALGELGMQADFANKSFFGEIAGFGDVRELASIGATRTTAGLFGDATAPRFGLRLAIGRDF